MKIKEEKKLSETSIVHEFNELTEEERVAFVGKSLDLLVEYSRSKGGIKKLVKVFAPLLFSAVKQPSAEDLKTISQFVTVFLYSIKEEFRYKWAELLHNLYRFKTKQMVPQLTHIPERQKEVDSLKFIHAGMSPKTYRKLNSWIMNNNVSNWDEVFNTLLAAAEQVANVNGEKRKKHVDT